MICDSLAECVHHEDPTEHPDYTEAEIQALRAMWDGQASERQQRLAMEYWIRACGTHDRSFRPESDRLTTFAEGKRFMGTNMIWMLKTAPTKTDPDKIAARLIGEQRG